MKEFVLPAARTALKRIPEDHPDREAIQGIVDRFGGDGSQLSLRKEKEEFARKTAAHLAVYLSRFSPETPIQEIVPSRYANVQTPEYENFLLTLSNRERKLISAAFKSLSRECNRQAIAIRDISNPEALPDLIQTAGDVTPYIQAHEVRGAGRSSAIILSDSFQQFIPTPLLIGESVT